MILQLASYSSALKRASEQLDPSEIAIYTLNLAKAYNRFYTQLSILNAESQKIIDFRLYLTSLTSQRLNKCLQIFGISSPERM